jgi:hypothetical protein
VDAFYKKRKPPTLKGLGLLKEKHIVIYKIIGILAELQGINTLINPKERK